MEKYILQVWRTTQEHSYNFDFQYSKSLGNAAQYLEYLTEKALPVVKYSHAQ